jgi:hypothetical protein
MSKKMFFAPIGVGLDVDAQAFITATGITNVTQQNAINTLVLNFKAYGLWAKMKAIYPIVGGTAFTHKFNLKDPRDLDVAYRLSFVSVTHSSTGVLGNGTGYVDTYLNPFLNLTLNNTHLSNYCRTNTSGNIVDMYASGSGSAYGLYQRFSNIYYSDCYNTTTNRNSISNSDSSGFFATSRTSATSLKMYKNNSILLTSTTAQVSALPNGKMFLMALDMSQNRSNREYSFFTIGNGLSDAEQSNLYTSILTFNTTLGR